MNDVVIGGYVKRFARERGLAHFSDSELFEAYVTSTILRTYHQCDITDVEDGILVGGSEDGGLDAVAIIVNGRPVRTEEGVRFYKERGHRLDVEFVFVQAKSSSGFSAGEIGTFVYGAEQFFEPVNKKQPSVRFNSKIQQLYALACYIYDQVEWMREIPTCHLYYVTTGKWTDEQDPSGRLAYGENQLRQKSLFSDVHTKAIDAELLTKMGGDLVRGVKRTVEFKRAAAFPPIQGVEQAYIGLLDGNQFIKLVSTPEGDLNRELFYDNVRDFQGDNHVNLSISDTLIEEKQRRNFPLFNNGVTIVARELNQLGDIFTISDFQIVNGCQTTYVVFENRESLDPETYVPIKLLATSDTQVITDVIRATNSQTQVPPEAFESLTQFHKDLEDYYRFQEESRDFSERVYYERRSKQYAREEIAHEYIVSLNKQIKSFLGMFLNEPHSNPRRYAELLKSNEERLFAKDHQPDPYYASGIALLMVEKWINSSVARREWQEYQYHLLMLLRVFIGGQHMPKFNSQKIRSYSLKIVNALRDSKRLDQECTRAIDLIDDALGKFDLSGDGSNPPYRLRAFTLELLKITASTPQQKKADSLQNSPPPDGYEKGTIKWFDDWKGFGFIEQDSGEDIFVHETMIGQVPWHLRYPGKRVKFKTVPNTRRPGKMMASEVKLEAN